MPRCPQPERLTCFSTCARQGLPSRAACLGRDPAEGGEAVQLGGGSGLGGSVRDLVVTLALLAVTMATKIVFQKIEAKPENTTIPVQKRRESTYTLSKEEGWGELCLSINLACECV